MSSDRSRGIESVQGVVAFGAITLGVIPLVMVLLGRSPGLLRIVLPNGPHPSHWIAPLVVIAFSAIVILFLEQAKGRR